MTFLLLFSYLLKLLSLKLRLTLKGLNLSISQRNALVATESIKIMAHVNEVHSASAKKKKGPSLPEFCHLGVHVIWQQSAPESEKFDWVNNGYKLSKQSGLWETQEDLLVFPGFLANSIFSFAFLYPPQCI